VAIHAYLRGVPAGVEINLFGIPRRDVTIAEGKTGRRKSVRLAGLTLESATRALEAASPA
jgi:uncharacterized protein YggU (UPF0235/DUF167 family)